MKLHPASLLVGAALAIGVGLLSAQQIVGSPAVEVRVVEMPIDQMRQLELVRHEGAHPRNYVTIEEGTPYTVPVGHLLVIKQSGLGDGGGPLGPPQVWIDGVMELGNGYENSLGNYTRSSLVPGYVVQPGSVVEAKNGGTSSVLILGYLADL